MVDAVIELIAQMRQTKERLAARVLQTLHACQGHFQGNGNLPLHFLGERLREAAHLGERELGDDRGEDVDAGRS